MKTKTKNIEMINTVGWEVGVINDLLPHADGSLTSVKRSRRKQTLISFYFIWSKSRVIGKIQGSKRH